MDKSQFCKAESRRALTICSMTGYATSTLETTAGTLTLEIKSVNSRFLDLQFRLNDDLRMVEPLLREAIMRRITRGKVECRLSFGRKADTGVAQKTNAAILAALAQLQREVHSHFAGAAALSVNELLRWPGVLEEAGICLETMLAEVDGVIADCMQSLVDTRAREGLALHAMLTSRIVAMQAIIQRITPLIPQIVVNFQQKAVERLEEALKLGSQNQAGGSVSTATQNLSRQEILERIRQEVTLYGIRIDVSEELSRLTAHLDETVHILTKGGPVGKRLDFMMQELNREANTLGSKAASKELTDAAMELKLLIEQMREQVQNLE